MVASKFGAGSTTTFFRTERKRNEANSGFKHVDVLAEWNNGVSTFRWLRWRRDELRPSDDDETGAIEYHGGGARENTWQVQNMKAAAVAFVDVIRMVTIDDQLDLPLSLRHWNGEVM